MIAPSIYIPHRPLFGIALVIAGFQVLSLMDGVAKYLAAEYPVLQISWARFGFHVLCVLPIVLWRGAKGWFPAAMYEGFARLMPNAERADVPAGHLVPMEIPAQAGDAIRRLAEAVT